MKTVGRSEGRSATACAAYRAGEKITDERTGKEFDYTKKNGVLHSAVLLPDDGTMNRAELWNSVEKHHKRGDAVVAREVVVALPVELSDASQIWLANHFARHIADRYGVGVDVAIHAPSKEGDDRNYHAHILMTGCYADQAGKLGKKCVELDPIHCKRNGLPTPAESLREYWAHAVNTALLSAGINEQIDHRSHAARGIAESPTEHLGVAAVGFERRTGLKSDRRLEAEETVAKRAEMTDCMNQVLDEFNRTMESLNQEIERLERRQAERLAALAPPTPTLPEKTEPLIEIDEFVEIEDNTNAIPDGAKLKESGRVIGRISEIKNGWAVIKEGKNLHAIPVQKIPADLRKEGAWIDGTVTDTCVRISSNARDPLAQASKSRGRYG